LDLNKHDLILSVIYKYKIKSTLVPLED
jgi:hypothetical protein